MAPRKPQPPARMTVRKGDEVSISDAQYALHAGLALQRRAEGKSWKEIKEELGLKTWTEALLLVTAARGSLLRHIDRETLRESEIVRLLELREGLAAARNSGEAWAWQQDAKITELLIALGGLNEDKERAAAASGPSVVVIPRWGESAPPTIAGEAVED